MESLLVMVPTRGRRELCERLLKSFEQSLPNDETVLMFITDEDDKSYEDFDWGTAVHAVSGGGRKTLVEIFNNVADLHVNDFDAIMTVGDDHTFESEHWDQHILDSFAELGDTGFVYPDCKKRYDVPEIIAISSDVIKALGHFAEPTLGHFYVDNVWGELGMRSGMLKYCPKAVIPHLHYTVVPGVERDATYAEAENAHGNEDRAAYLKWRNDLMPLQVSQLRRKFNPDVQWILNQF